MRLIYSCLCSKLPRIFGKSIEQFNFLYDFIRHTIHKAFSWCSSKVAISSFSV
jgi:hypothetical protein